MENQILACQAIYAGRNIWVLVMLAAENMVNGPPLSGWIYGPRGSRGFLYMNRYQYSIHSFLILPSRFASCRVAKTCRKSRSLLKGGIAHVSSIISWKSILRLDAIWLVVPARYGVLCCCDSGVAREWKGHVQQIDIFPLPWVIRHARYVFRYLSLLGLIHHIHRVYNIYNIYIYNICI